MFKNKKKKGFTLIELLIVVAIIAILAAIAIPQFAQYRIKGYNASANSDVRNAKTSEEALYADYQAYGDAGDNSANHTGTVTLTTKDTSNNPRTITTGCSNNVYMSAYTGNSSGGFTAGQQGVSYLVFTKHTQGDRIFAADGNATTIYWKSGTAGSDLTVGWSAIGSTTGSDLTASGYTAL